MAGRTREGRRGYGQGSIDEVSPGVWRLRVFIGRHPVTGRPVQRGRRYHGTKAGAERALNALRSEVDHEKQFGLRSPPPRGITVNEVIELHLRALGPTLAPGTLVSYESSHRLYLSDGFGKRRVESLTAQDFRDLYVWLKTKHSRSDSSIWTVYALLSGALSRAVREHGVGFDSIQLVTPPKPVRRKQQRATDRELAAVFHHSAVFGADWPFFFRLACATGMRRGELVGLRWSSLDETGTLYVDTNIVATPGVLLPKPPKNGDPRYVRLDDETVRRWSVLRDVMARDFASNGFRFSTDGFVFCAAFDGATPRRPDRVSKVWDLLREKHGINPQLEFRALRNWHVTVLDDDLGFDLAKIARRVGHTQRSNSAMTNHYSLSDRKVDEAMASGVGRILDQIDRMPLAPDVDRPADVAEGDDARVSDLDDHYKP